MVLSDAQVANLVRPGSRYKARPSSVSVKPMLKEGLTFWMPWMGPLCERKVRMTWIFWLSLTSQRKTILSL